MRKLGRRKLVSILMATALVLSFVVAPGMSTVAAEADETEDAEIEMYAEITEEENSDVIATKETTDFEDEIVEARSSAVGEEETMAETEAGDEENAESETEAGEEDAEVEIKVDEESDEDEAATEFSDENQAESLDKDDPESDEADDSEGGIAVLRAGNAGDFEVSGGTSGTDFSYSNNTLTIKTSTALTITMAASGASTTTDHITVSSGVSANLTLDGLTIDMSGNFQTSPLDLSAAGASTITLTGSNTMKAGSGSPGIYVPDGKQITFDGSGSLTVTGGGLRPGIGWVEKGGNIVINSGTIEAHGGDSAAGIGGSWTNGGGTITINGGTIEAYGGDSAAGIGGGWTQDGGTITINGGTVTATGGTWGAGIGGGSQGDGGAITINDGTVTATGGWYAAGIGGGEYANGGTITINGGTVTATGGYNASGIGGGDATGYGGGAGGTITITGGTVTATGGEEGSGIGGGNYGASGTINISGGMVTATSEGYAAGIGGGHYKGVDGITISGGTVIASSQNGGAGIGKGDGGSEGGTITIENCVIYASSITGFDASSCSGIISNNDVDGTATVYGSPTFSSVAYIPEGKTARIEDGKTVTIASGTTLTNYGTLYQDWGSTFNRRGTYNSGTTYYQVKNSLTGFGQDISLSGVSTYSDNTYATENTTVSLPVGYVCSDFSVRRSNSNVSTSDGRSFTMPNKPVEVTGFLQKEITESMFSVSTDPETYTGSKITKAISGSDGGSNLTEDTDYTVEYTNNTNAGKATITITGEGNYTGTLTYEFDIAKADQDISYENKELHHLENAHSFTNGLTVTRQSTDSDSKITYSSSDDSIAFVDPNTGEVNIDGTGTVTITATAVETDNFNGATASYTLEIVQPEETVSEDVEKVYDGGDIYLYAEVEHDEELGDAEGLTYTYYWYRNNELISSTTTAVLRLSGDDVSVQADTEYYCIIVMKDEYFTDYIYQSLTVTITAKEIDEDMFEVDTGKETYTGSEITKTITGYDEGAEAALTVDKDYTVSYANNVNVGTATITITGIGNYDGELSYTFVINKAVYDMSGIGFADATYTYNGEEQAVEITGELPDGVTVSYTDNIRVNAGSQTATATFTGDADNYEEIPDMTAELTILEATFGDMAVTATGYSGTYDGEGHTITVELSGNAEGAEVTYSTDEDGEYSDENPAFTDVGTYTVYYKVSKENYEYVTGSLTVEITERTITTDMFDVDTKAKTYTGEPITTSIDSALAEGIDYTVSYEDNKDVGTATITITGIGNYTGTLTYTFEIVEEEKGSGGSGGGDGGTGGKGNTGTNGTGTGANGGETTGSGNTGANTADTNAPILYSFLIVLAGAAIVTLGVRRRSARR